MSNKTALQETLAEEESDKPMLLFYRPTYLAGGRRHVVERLIMQSPEKTYRTRFWLVCGCAFLAFFAAAYATATGVLPPRGFAAVILLICACLMTAILMLIRSLRNDVRKQRELLGASSPEFVAITSDRQARSIRSVKRMIAFFAIALVVGLWTTRKQPLGPRAVGAAFDLLIISYMVWVLLKLRQLRAKSSGGEQRSNS